ncbi:multiple sugar transport system permease protein [Bosea sp. BE271]|jgi:multiple sugar transport system permease protein|nr:sugar ABC transporter permease [Bosea sp. 47.2.35]MDR6826556.1 multiple sugar transport system permease protein [Bosea robiniae]MDR6893266.1 multiple sugar transport system permease protein [Bosea sp. BE109]MDR7137035.1 multiple sugar transport system permease protein [Bosea sp. BE168]MDR7173734.1 multiple sugar transport system permease protein [Bosea sp. BE271]
MSTAAMTAPLAAPRDDASGFTRDRAMWGAIMLAPYVLVFAVMVVYPVAYGLWLGLNWNSYRALFADPIFIRTVVNTIIFLFVAVNLKFLIALMLSGFFVQQRPWIRIVLVLFILPWAVPSIPTILSFRVMLNPENGMLNQQLFQWFGIMEGPGWLTDPTLAFICSIFVHIWKSLPFWTLILITGRLAIAQDLYEAASVDGANRWQQFRFITWPSLATLYVTSTMLSMIWTLGDFNSVYLLTGGGPGDLNHVLATLGIRYMRNNNLDLGIASIIVAMPLILPMVFVMVKRLSKGPDA